MDMPAAMVALPVSDAEATACLGQLKGTRPLLAISGGVDSMALMGLAAGWADQNDVAVRVAIVDHGLRDASASEAAFVVDRALQLSLPASILRWQGDKPVNGIQEAARMARYDLLTRHAHAVGATAIVTAHTLDDQAETLMMRLAAGSGPTGMAGMQARSVGNDLPVLRPLLGVAKDRLIATCRARGWQWIEDPSNRSEAFTRVRWRALMPLLANEGLTADRLGQFARRMAETELAMQHMTAAALDRCALERSENGWSIDAVALFGYPDAIVVRVLAALFTSEDDEGQHSHGPRLARLEACASAMRDARALKLPLTRTLAGHLLTLRRDGRLVCKAESVRRRGCVNPVRRVSLGNGLPEN